MYQPQLPQISLRRTLIDVAVGGCLIGMASAQTVPATTSTETARHAFEAGRAQLAHASHHETSALLDQGPTRGDLVPLENAEVRNVGTYHVATGKLTPPAHIDRGSDGPTLDEPIYNNTAYTGFYRDIINGTPLIDEGRIPSPTSPGIVGTQTNYTVTGIQFAYGTDATDPSLGGTGVTFRLDFYDHWSICTPPSQAPSPIYSAVIGPLGGSTSGAVEGLVVEVDTTGTGFCIQADGDGVSFISLGDLFGWSVTVIDAGDATAIGPVTAGGPASGALEGDGTAFQNPGAPGSGLTTLDTFSAVSSGVEGCYFFGGSPFASYWMLLRADITEGCFVGTDLCAGVSNSTGNSAILRASGSNAAADNAVFLNTSSLPMDSMGYYLVSQDSNVVTNPGGSAGNLCIASLTFGRYANFVLDSGNSGQVGLQLDLTAIPLASAGGTATTAGMAGETYNFQYWYRDFDGMGAATSNFSSATSITLQ